MSKVEEEVKEMDEPGVIELIYVIYLKTGHDHLVEERRDRVETASHDTCREKRWGSRRVKMGEQKEEKGEEAEEEEEKQKEDANENKQEKQEDKERQEEENEVVGL